MKQKISTGLLLSSLSLFVYAQADESTEVKEQILNTVGQNKVETEAAIAEVKSQNEKAIKEFKKQQDKAVTELEKKLEAVRRQASFANAHKIVGDRISYSFDIPGKEITIVSDGSKYKGCIPAGLEMRVFTEPDKDGNVLAVILPGSYDDSECDLHSKKDKSSHPLAKKLIKISADIAGAAPRRRGWTYGTLFVPYKVLLKGSRDLKSSATIGPYAGYRKILDSGWEIKYVAFAGPSIIENSTIVNDNIVTDNLYGLSYGIGVLGTIKNEFQLGLLFGADRVNESSKYEDNGKIWFALAFGYEFE